MKLLMHVLKNNNKLGIDNESINLKEIDIKLDEEFREVGKAILDYQMAPTFERLKEIVRETFDLIQVSILLLWKCHRIGKKLNDNSLIQEVNIEHKDKLINRGWIPKTGIEIDVKE